MLARLLNYLLNKIIWFGSKTETVTHQTHWPVSAKDAFEICRDYAAFLEVMLRDQKDHRTPAGRKADPAELVGRSSTCFERDGSTNIIVEQVVELTGNDATGTCTLAWEQLSSEPQLPLRGYGCSWSVEPVCQDPPCCHLVWTRHFKEPLLFGLISLAGYMKWNFQLSAGPIMDRIFRQYYAAKFPPQDRRAAKTHRSRSGDWSGPIRPAHGPSAEARGRRSGHHDPGTKRPVWRKVAHDPGQDPARHRS